MAIEEAESSNDVGAYATEEQVAAFRFMRTDLAAKLFAEEDLRRARKALFNELRAEHNLLGRLKVGDVPGQPDYLAISPLL